MLNEQKEATENRIRFRLYTGNRWMSGYVTTPHRRLVDLFNKEQHQSLLIEELSIQGGSRDEEVGQKGQYSYINASTILFAVPLDEPAFKLRPADPLVWVKKRPQRTRFGLGPFTVMGEIHLLENAAFSPSFLPAGDRFAPVTNAVLGRDDDPQFREEEDVIFVNKDRIEYLVADESPAA